MRQWPLEGRGSELVSVREAFSGSAVNAVLVRAAAGMGKTRLTREALHGLDCRTEWVAATRAATSIPFGALAHLLPDDVQPSAMPVGFVRAVCSRVAGWGGRTKVAIGVDDAHLLDDASSTVIANLVAAGAAFVVLTARTGEPLADCLARLGKEGEATILDLCPLSSGVIDRLIDHDTGGRIDAANRRRLRAAARGNPLALRELLHGAVPGGLTDLVSSRLDGLDPATRHVVEMVACGEPVPLGFLERQVGLPAVTAAEDSGLVVCEKSGARVQARLDHPLFGEVMRARMGAARSRRVYRDLAGQLLSTPMRRREDTLRAALWQVESGQIVRPDLVREGARQAIGRAGLVLAERLARAAREAEPGAETDWLLAEILEYQGRSDEATDLVPATPPAQLTDRIRWAVTRADGLYWAYGNLAGAAQALDTAAGQTTIEGARAFILFFAGRCPDAVQTAREVLDREDSDPQGVVWAAAAGTASLGFLGRIDEAEQVRTRGNSVAAAHMAALPWGAFQIEIGACLAYLACGYPRTAAAIAADGYDAAVRSGVPMMVSGWALYRGMAAATQGDLSHADVLLAEALAGFDRTDTFRLRRCCLAAGAWVQAMRGRGPAASDLMAQADRLDNGTNQIFAAWIDTWRAWVAQACGDTAAATEHATRAADLATAAGMPGVAAMARYDVVRLGGAVDPAQIIAPPQAAPTTAAVPATAAAFAATRALSEAGGAALAEAADGMERLGYHLHAAELATAAARALRRAGNRGRSGLATANAAALRARCPDARTPMVAHDDLSDLLTARERQVALLASRHTSRHIAQRLGLAVATVNNTLARAYTKLGVTGREELRALLGIDDDCPDAGRESGG
ncbi:LuxR family transcriptional regulator [Rugosimonospora africana]|uniref:LuxR family transcriptional regulator n=1 Tax=Rugosimonospora africana TaxID=556532 RepID=A0A8J3VUA7_9ACTN|nr:LuxR family transcriptional regulator [Rugosimonospora africana]GIH18536.1 LuxR family transcriptional regulator [Rugosimonospora africana]